MSRSTASAVCRASASVTPFPLGIKERFVLLVPFDLAMEAWVVSTRLSVVPCSVAAWCDTQIRGPLSGSSPVVGL